MRKKYKVSFDPLNPAAKAFLWEHTGIDFSDADFNDGTVWFCCTVSRNQWPVTVIVFELKSPHDAHFTLAVADARGLSRQLITAIYRTVFSRAARITALIDPANQKAIDAVWRMGFKPEGYLRLGYDGKRDAHLWGLLPEDCPYLAGTPFRYRVLQATHQSAERLQ